MRKQLLLLLTFSTLATTLVFPSFSSSGIFKDLPRTHWAYSNVMTLTKSGIIKGYDDGTFRPNQTMREDEFIVLMMRSLGYTYETTGYFAEPYLDKARALGLYMEKSKYYYERNISREVLFSVAARAAKLKTPEINRSSNTYLVKDVPDIYDVSYFDDILDAYHMGLVGNFKGKFLPNEEATRAEACSVVLRVVNERLRKPFIAPSEMKNTMVTLIDKQLTFDANGKEVAWDEFDFNLKDTYTYKIIQVPFYAPYWNGKPLNEVVDFAKLLKDYSGKERGHLLFVAWDGSDNEPQSASVKGYKSKAFLDDRLDTSKYPESEAPFLLAERMDFDLSVEIKNLSHKYSPYHMDLWRKDEHADGFKTYSAFFNSTYGDRIRPMFDFWFEDKADYAWNKFLNSLNAGEDILYEEIVNGRHYKIYASYSGVSLSVSLKRF